jgi:putative ABC transport system substrate-binding protein
MRRRDFIAGLGGVAAWPVVSRAQQAQRARIGWITVAPHPFISGFRRGLRDLGWSEGENLVIDFRSADGHPDRLDGLATAMARDSPAVVIASGSDAVDAVVRNIDVIPIVGISASMGLGGSLARPKGNLTGIALLYDELAAKWPEFLLKMFPRAQHIGVLFDKSPANEREFQSVKATATVLGKTLLPLPISNSDAIREALDDAHANSADSLVFVSSPIFTANATRIVELVGTFGLPAIYEDRVLVLTGGLMSYGPNLNEEFRRVAFFADRILKGTKPADLPIERPSKFELVINRKTAKVLGLPISPTLLALADEVIE